VKFIWEILEKEQTPMSCLHSWRKVCILAYKQSRKSLKVVMQIMMYTVHYLPVYSLIFFFLFGLGLGLDLDRFSIIP
jgi:hypothetical protein